VLVDSKLVIASGKQVMSLNTRRMDVDAFRIFDFIAGSGMAHGNEFKDIYFRASSIPLAKIYWCFGIAATQSTSINICGGKTTCTVVRAG
jgi:hypothetical protein